jgi:hypothetical protein
MVYYVEEPVPKDRLLIYGAQKTDLSYRVIYNCSYYSPQTKYYVHPVSNYIIFIPLEKSGTQWLIKNGKMYDFSAEKYVGRLEIPPKEKCVYVKRALPFDTLDMKTLAFYCRLPQSMYMTLTLYNVLCEYEENELVCRTVDNSSTEVFIPHQIPVAFYFELLLGTDAGLIFAIIDALVLVIFRKINVGLTTKQQRTLPVTGQCHYLTTNHRLGIFLGRFESPLSHLGGLELIPFIRQPLVLKSKDNWVRQLHIDIIGLGKVDRKQFKENLVTFDHYRHILQIHHNRDQHGNYVFSAVHGYVF